MHELPTGVTTYKTTAEFTEQSVPAGLLSRHRTRAEVWGRIVVIEGTLLYRIVPTGEEVVLDPSRPGIIRPEELHEVSLIGPVRFRVEFLRA